MRQHLSASILIITLLLPLYSYTQVIFWQEYFGGTSHEMGKAIFFDEDGTVVIGGQTKSQNQFGKDNHGEEYDWVVFKYNSQGQILWQNTLGGSGNDELNHMIETDDGGYMLIGTTMSTDGDVTVSHGKMDIWVAKLDDIGNITWARAFGGAGNDQGFTIIQTSDGGYLLGGESGSHRSGYMRSTHHGSLDAWVAKLDSAGNLEWEKHYGGGKNEKTISLHEVKPNTYIIVNATTSTDGDVKVNLGKKDVWILEIQEEGEINWQANFGGEDYDEVHASKMDKDGNIVLVGTTFSKSRQILQQFGGGDFWLFKISQEGGLIWSRTYGGSKADGANDIFCTKDGGYILCGTSKSTDGDNPATHGYYDAWVLKINSKGDKMWGQTFGKQGNDRFESIYEVPTGGYVATGTIQKPPDKYINNQMVEVKIPGHHGGYDLWVTNFGDPSNMSIAPFITPPSLIGTVLDRESNQPLGASITLTDNATLDSLTAANTHPESGNFNLILPDDGIVSINVMTKGYLFFGQDMDLDTIINKASVRKTVKLDKIRMGSKLTLSNIYFKKGKWDLLPKSFPELERLVAFLNLNPRVKIQINGHTDDTGDKNSKIELSERRAKAVQDYLIKQGIDDFRLKVKGYGMYRPVAPNTTESGRRRNRRVEFEVFSI